MTDHFVALRGPVPKLTLEEMSFALQAGEAAASMRTPGASIGERFKETEERSEKGRLHLAEHPMNRFAMSILDAFAHDHQKGQAALWRAMAFHDVFHHPDFSKWSRPGEKDGPMEVHHALVHALASAPCTYKKKLPPARVFKLASKLKAEHYEDKEAR